MSKTKRAIGPNDFVIPSASEPIFGMAMPGPVVLRNVHNPSLCEGRGCPVHHPSDHRMVNWPLHWRADRGLMERLCPEHGTGHPDPDDIAYKVSIGLTSEGVHGCCGCCFGASL